MGAALAIAIRLFRFCTVLLDAPKTKFAGCCESGRIMMVRTVLKTLMYLERVLRDGKDDDGER